MPPAAAHVLYCAKSSSNAPQRTPLALARHCRLGAPFGTPFALAPRQDARAQANTRAAAKSFLGKSARPPARSSPRQPRLSAAFARPMRALPWSSAVRRSRGRRRHCACAAAGGSRALPQAAAGSSAGHAARRAVRAARAASACGAGCWRRGSGPRGRSCAAARAAPERPRARACGRRCDSSEAKAQRGGKEPRPQAQHSTSLGGVRAASPKEGGSEP
jgi:hypothetical protein